VTEHRREDGFTLIELMVTTVILGIVLAILFGVMASMMSTERRTQAFLQNQEKVRLTLTQIGRDLRGAQALDQLPDVTTYPYQVQFTKLDNSHWRWRLDTTSTSATYRRLVQEELVGATWTERNRLERVRNIDTNVPVFRYYRAASNAEFDPSTSLSADIASCAVRVHVAIQSDAASGPAPFIAESDVQIRNRQPGGIPQC
jgi:prepilin-type N-terminal cleavage/methylation domain-containing protein